METITVLKKCQVKEGGRFCLPVRSASAVSGAPMSRPVPAGGTPQVRLVETTADYSVLEVTCGCGQTLYIQCNYVMPTSP